MSQLSRNKEIVRRHLEVAINERRPELWDELMTPDFTMHHPLAKPGIDSYRSVIQMFWVAFPNASVEIFDLIAEDDRVVARYIERGTNVGEWLGRPGTGRTYEKRGIGIWRIDDGRLAEGWIQEDELGWERQLYG